MRARGLVQMMRTMKIAVVAPSCTLRPEAAEAVSAIAAARGDAELVIHPQCFLHRRPFRRVRTKRVSRHCARSWPTIAYDAIWFARGGYGSNRIAEAAAARPARRRRAPRPISAIRTPVSCLLHSTRPASMSPTGRWCRMLRVRAGRRRFTARSTGWCGATSRRWSRALRPGRRAMAFNLTVLSQPARELPSSPTSTGVELLIEDVAEHEYRIDRTMFHVTGSAAVRRVAQIRMGRISEIPENDPAFGSDAESIVRDWCERAGIAFGDVPISVMTPPIGSFRSTIAEINHFDDCLPLAHRGESRSISLRTTGGPNGKSMSGTGRKAGGGLARPVKPSADLAAIVGFETRCRAAKSYRRCGITFARTTCKTRITSGKFLLTTS